MKAQKTDGEKPGGLSKQVQIREKDRKIMVKFPKVGETTNAEVVSTAPRYATVQMDCGYFAHLPGRGYIEGEELEVRVVSITESTGNQPSYTVEAA